MRWLRAAAMAAHSWTGCTPTMACRSKYIPFIWPKGLYWCPGCVGCMQLLWSRATGLAAPSCISDNAAAWTVTPSGSSRPLQRTWLPDYLTPSARELGPISWRTRPPAAGELSPSAGELDTTVWQSGMAWNCYVVSNFRSILINLWHYLHWTLPPRVAVIVIIMKKILL